MNRFIAVLQEIFRPAGRARDGLRMKPAIGGIGVLAGAKITSSGHAFIVVFWRSYGKRWVTRVTRAAICAVDVGVVKAGIGRIEKFSQAIVANRQIRRNSRGGAVLMAAFAEC